MVVPTFFDKIVASIINDIKLCKESNLHNHVAPLDVLVGALIAAAKTCQKVLLMRAASCATTH